MPGCLMSFFFVTCRKPHKTNIMPWESKYLNLGIAIIDGTNVKVFCDGNNYITIGLGEDVTKAVWSGEELNITLKSGKIRRYRDRNYYSTI
jgi:hypothetical protein